jgi:hypothetical protein
MKKSALPALISNLVGYRDATSKYKNGTGGSFNTFPIFSKEYRASHPYKITAYKAAVFCNDLR